MYKIPGNLPSTIGVYIFKTKSGEILYIGKSVNIKARVKSHFENAKLDLKERAIIVGSSKIETIATESEFKALILESSLIQKFLPKYNKIWMDDKSYLYVRFSLNEEYPKISLIRKSDINSSKSQDPKTQKDMFFGPFSSRRTLESLLREIRRVIPFCSAKRITKTSCFYSKIGLCDPCPNYINELKNQISRSQDSKKIISNSKIQISKILQLQREYRENVREIIKIFQGKTEIVLKDLRKELNTLSKEQKYEEALQIRNRIERFEGLISERGFGDSNLSTINNKLPTTDLSSLLMPYFHNLGYLHRIECYDVSNLNFKEATAAMTVAVNGQIDKSQYRKFRVHSSEFIEKKKKLLRTMNHELRTGPVDWEMMKSIFLRRFKHPEWENPNLLVVDGGKPQVRMAVECMHGLNLQIPVIGIAKNPDRLVIGIPDLPTIRPELNNSGFNLIRLLRDEAHRFGRKYHLFLREQFKKSY